ncbi:MAG: 50S ribosomal protein L30 [Desulfobacterales bacterium]
MVKSMNGRPEKHRKILRGMGLTKLNKTVELEDTPSIRGMVNKVTHLVKVEV